MTDRRAPKTVHRRWVAAMLVAATLAAACSAAGEPTDPAMTGASDASSQSPDGDTPMPAGSGESSDGGAASAGSDASDGAASGDGPSDAADGSGDDGQQDAGTARGSPDPAGDQTAAEPGSADDGSVVSESSNGQAPQDGSAGNGVAADGAATDGAATPAGDGFTAADAGAGGGSYAIGQEPRFDPFVTGPVAALTGSITTDLGLAQRRPLAVKIGNGSEQDRPQSGLAAADIVYELLVEAGITRFLAVFHSEIPTRVGPVRSARSSDFDLLADQATPYLVTSGANSVVLGEMRAAARAGTLIDVGAARMFAPYSRDRSRRSPHNLYYFHERLAGGDGASGPGGPLDEPPEALFEYGSSRSAGLRDSVGVTLDYGTPHSVAVAHLWDNVLGGWVRIQDGMLHTAETDFGLAEIAPANVVVVWMPYGRSAADRISPQAMSYGSGEALVLTAGAVHEAQWERSAERAGFRFTDDGGNPLSLSSGATWLLLANTSNRWPIPDVKVLTASEGSRMLEQARAGADSA